MSEGDIAPKGKQNEQPAGKGFCTWFVAILAVSVAVIGFVVVATTAGSQQPKGIPKAAVVIFEGLQGVAFDKLMELNKLPNIGILAAQGTRSLCTSIDDSRCARTQSGSLLGQQYTWTSGPGIASILTGVNVNKHQVGNDTFDDYSKFATTSQTYPSFLTAAKKGGYSTQVIGASHLLTSNPSASLSAGCTLLGVADFECGVDAIGRCSQASSCNMNLRTTTIPINDFSGTEEVSLEGLIAAAFSGIPPDVLVVHSNKLSRLASDPAVLTATFDAASTEYAAEAYVLDTVMGQLSSYITQRVLQHDENWLIILTSDHGGTGKTFGSTTDQDEVIPFVLATLTGNGNLRLNALSLPTTHMDVAPTVLSWLGVSPISPMDGVVQGLCATGIVPADCPVTVN